MFLSTCWRRIINKMLTRILAVALKEIRQLSRDTRMLFVLFLFPVVLLILFGYAISFDVHHAKLGVFDKDKSEASRNFIKVLTSSEYFDLVTVIRNESEIKNDLDRQTVQAVMVIPENFSQNFYSNREVKLQILVDGVNGNTAAILQNYINTAVLSYSQKLAKEVTDLTAKRTYIPIKVESLFWYNPTLNSTYMLIPGLIAMILVLTAVISISLSIVREKEKGTVEQILVSPVSSTELLVGKVLPYIFVSLFIGGLILVLSYFLFGLVVKGSLIDLFLTTMLFVFASLALGIFVSSIAKSQQVAFQLATLVSMLPATILSGFIFPIESMPPVVQVITNITPAKFYLTILKNIILKGTGFNVFWPDVIYLNLFAFFFLTLAILINKKSRIA